MIRTLTVRDFAIVDQISVEFSDGMTVLTGETGAGKSILIDAVALVLGERGSAQAVRQGAKRAEFSAEFDIESLDDVQRWLTDQALDQEGECLLRRNITAEGRSRAFINGTPVTLQQLKSLGERLLDIHGQHFHQSLVRRDVQLELLDHFGGLKKQRATVADRFAEWQTLRDERDALLLADSDRGSRIDLLRFQLDELDTLAVAENEVDELQLERQKLRNSGRLADGVAQALAAVSEQDGGNAYDLLAEASRQLDSLADLDDDLASIADLLNSATIQAAEAGESLRRYQDSMEADPARQEWVESRLDAIATVARKHRIEPAAVDTLAADLAADLERLDNAEQLGADLEARVAAAADTYLKAAKRLSTSRNKSAKQFSAAVTDAMDGLGMAGGRFNVELQQRDDADGRATGIDDIAFLISANPGQAPMPLARVASGGELSRMSLAIQVIASDGSAIPTMIFDEVDSGVGGGVAEMVGRRLQEIGRHHQVLCVTHLPQVASLASQHYRINKVSDGKATRTGVSVLDHDGRVEEIARMLGGVDITRKTLEHAAEMLAGADRKRA